MSPVHTKSQLEATVRDALAEARRRLEQFAALDPSTPFADAVIAFDRIGAPLNGVAERVGLFVHVHGDAQVREAARRLQVELEAFSTEFGMHRGAYERLARLEPNAPADGPAARVLCHALRDFRRAGVDRDEPTRERIRALREELLQLGQSFDEHIVTGGRTMRIPEGSAALVGLPEDFVRQHPPGPDGAVTLSTDPADRLPFLSFAERDDLRREYFVLCQNRAVPQNLFVLPQLLAKRRELAGLLGYPSWAAYVTEDKMSKSPAAVREFIERVAELVRPRAEAELSELLEVKRERLGVSADAEAAWIGEHERLYWIEQVKARRYSFDSREARPYFSLERVCRGVIATSEALYGVRIERVVDPAVWHPSVETYEVREPDGRTIARFHLDLFPREGKFKHAAMFPLRSGLLGEALAEAALVCNLPEPKPGEPALLLHDEVTTLFHEFGHLFHHLFAGRHSYLRFSGIACEWDFVEVPSQLYEEWAWDSGILASFALHVETGEPIPAALVQRMRAAEEYGKALHVLVQTYYARLSLELYEADLEGRDLTQLAIEWKRRMLPFPHAEGTYFHASFGHLEGYTAMYYTYLWSLVIAKDALAGFADGLMDQTAARAWRERVLEPGGALDAAELVHQFLGRETRFEAFERWLTGSA